eukprot:3866881-Rhodomonas_salina.1
MVRAVLTPTQPAGTERRYHCTGENDSTETGHTQVELASLDEYERLLSEVEDMVTEVEIATFATQDGLAEVRPPLFSSSLVLLFSLPSLSCASSCCCVREEDEDEEG